MSPQDTELQHHSATAELVEYDQYSMNLKTVFYFGEMTSGLTAKPSAKFFAL